MYIKMEIEGKKEAGCIEVCDDSVRDDRDRQRACWCYSIKANTAGFIGGSSVLYVRTQKAQVL